MVVASLFRVSALSVIVICGLMAVDQAAPGVFVAEAVAQDKPKKDTRETRRTPALRNKVYERLAEAQTLAEAKDYACLLYTSPSPRDISGSRMPSSA